MGFCDMSYDTSFLHPQLLFIVWKRNPLLSETKNFLKTIQESLSNTTQPLYFMSDLRHGRIMDIRAISELGKLSEHALWGGGTAFSQSPTTRIFVSNFQQRSQNKERNLFFNTPEESIHFLTGMIPDIISQIDWQAIIP